MGKWSFVKHPVSLLSWLRMHSIAIGMELRETFCPGATHTRCQAVCGGCVCARCAVGGEEVRVRDSIARILDKMITKIEIQERRDKVSCKTGIRHQGEDARAAGWKSCRADMRHW